MEKYKADKNAKNIEGQVAADLVTDPTHPAWKNVFSVIYIDLGFYQD